MAKVLVALNLIRNLEMLSCRAASHLWAKNERGKTIIAIKMRANGRERIKDKIRKWLILIHKEIQLLAVRTFRTGLGHRQHIEIDNTKVQEKAL